MKRPARPALLLVLVAMACAALALLWVGRRNAREPGSGFTLPPGALASAPEPTGPYLQCELKSLTQRGAGIVACVRLAPANGLGRVLVDLRDSGFLIGDCRMWGPGYCPVHMQRRRLHMTVSYGADWVWVPPEGLEATTWLGGSWHVLACGAEEPRPLPARCQADYEISGQMFTTEAGARWAVETPVWGVGRADYRREKDGLLDLVP